jgi:hypothetical protein
MSAPAKPCDANVTPGFDGDGNRSRVVGEHAVRGQGQPRDVTAGRFRANCSGLGAHRAGLTVGIRINAVAYVAADRHIDAVSVKYTHS